ncbi:MAG: CHAT domain-containing protein [Thermodesulfobacteriota bacterium]
MKRIGTAVSGILLLLLLQGCAGLSKDIQLSSYMQKKQHHAVISVLQDDLDQNRPLTSFQLYLLAAAYYEIRDYDKMLKAVDRMEAQIARGDTDYYGADLKPVPGILRGYAYLDQGEWEKAVQQASEAQAILERPGAQSNNFYRSQLIDVESILGVAYANLGERKKAERCLEVINGVNLAMSNLGPEKYIALARIQLALKNFPSALAAVRNPDAKVSGLITAFYDQTFQELPKVFILTKCLYETGNIKEAKEGYDKLLSHPQIKQVGGMYWPALLDRARIARKEGDNKTAEALLREAADVIEQQRASIVSEAGRIGYVGDKQDVYQEIVVLLLEENRPGEAFAYVERAKSRALVDLLASQKSIAPRGREAAPAEGTFLKLASAEKDLDIMAAPGQETNGARTRGVVVALKHELAGQAPEFSSLVSVTGAPPEEIRKRLGENETLMEYYRAGKDWYVFVLTRDGLAAKNLGTLDLDREVREFRAALTDPSSSAFLKYSGTLHDELIRPVSGMLKPGRLTIVPHGPLHYMPFCALYSGGRFLVDRSAIRILPAADVLQFLKGRPVREDAPTLVMGNPDLGDPKLDLGFAQEEAEAIAGLMPNATLLVRDEARASFLEKDASDYTVIHLAAHGVFSPDDPLGSALLLAKDGANDGRLTAGDLYRLQLNAGLVTLSACETALGKVTKGDDVVGFTRGFLYAGAGSIVSTLWQVDDRATKDLMLLFYSNLKSMEKDEALRQAQILVKKQYGHPFYWASFELTGNAR